MPPHRADFRPDIEGLRGVAILLVVLYHAGVSGLSGGFVGVDVFFVLSGFFITRLLVRELADTGDVDLSAFYGRRALRLLPPLLLVLGTTLALVSWLYAPIDRAPIAETARAVALSSSNIEFAEGAVDYFSTGDDPLLHTWSLSVEQQFYLVWPLLFVLVGFLAQWRGTPDATAAAADARPPARLLAFILVAGALSFALSLWLTRVAQPWAFFGMPTRIWEFALGGALAVAMTERTGEGTAGAVLQGAGLLAIAIAVIAYDRATPYPGIAALLPAAGAVAVLAAGSHAASTAVGRALAAPWLRSLGRLSYAWYLWHWPLIGLGAVLQPSIGVVGRLAWSLAALGLAWFTYRFVERSAQDGRLSRLPASWLPAASLGATLGALLVSQLALVAAERRVAQPDQRAFAAARTDRMDHGCWARTVEHQVGPCTFGDRSSSVTVALLGDSHAEHWLGALDRIGRERGWKIVAMVKGGCPVAELPAVGGARRARHSRDCARYREAMVQRIIAMRPTVAILSSWDHYVPVNGRASDEQTSPVAWGRGLRSTYARLSAAGIRSVAIRGTPRAWFDVPSCLSRQAARLPFARECSFAPDGSLSPRARAAQTAAARGLPVRFVDMNDQICGPRRCAPVRNGVVVFTDDNHLTASFSRSVAPVLHTRLTAAFGQLGVRLP